MKINYSILTIALVFASAITAFAQDKEPSYYLKIYAGYTVMTPGASTLYPSSIVGVLSGEVGSYSNGSKGLGAGFTTGIGLEKSISSRFLVGLDINYLNGKALISNYNITYSNTQNVNYTGSAPNSVLSIVPNISYKILPQPKYYIYTRLGLITAIKTKYQIIENTEVEDGSSSGTEAYSQVNNYGVNLGLNTAVGIRFNIVGALKGIFEISDNFLPVSPTSSATTDENHLGTQAYSYYTTNYIKSKQGTYYSQDGIPQTLPSFVQHINSVVLNFGVALAIK